MADEPTIPPVAGAPALTDPAAPESARGTGAPGRGASAVNPKNVLGGRYHVEARAGAGGQGVVYRATDMRLGRRVAVKLLTGLGPSQRGELDPILREARAMAMLGHEGLCKVHDVVLEASRPYMIMEWVDGQPLTEAWRGLSRDARLSMFLRVVDAAAAIHSAGLVHRDLKSANILVVDGRPVIVDFGLANSVSDGEPGRGGTPGCAAPEQFVRGGQVGPAADVFGLGIMLYELLTDSKPFVAEATPELVRLVSSTDPVLPESLAPDCPAELQKVCLKAMERDPARRYPHAMALAEDVRLAMSGRTVQARPTILAGRFNEEVARQIGALASWRRLGMVSDREYRDLSRRLEALTSPESSWILESRQLAHSQVWLHLGGWLTVLAMAFGLGRSWPSIPGFLRLLLPSLLVGLLTGAGLALIRRAQRQVALVFLVTACVGFPVAATLFWRQTEWLASDSVGQGDAELIATPWGNHADPESQGFFNIQILMTGLLWIGASLVLRWITRSGAFTFFAMFGLATTVFALFGTFGLTELESKRDVVGTFGLFALPWLVAATALGVALARRESRRERVVGVARQGEQDAAPVLALAVFGLFVALVLLTTRPTIYLLPPVLAPGNRDAQTALCFIANGFVLFGLHRILSRQPGLIAERLCALLRWIMPAHLLGPIIALHQQDLWGIGGVWLLVLAGCCAGLGLLAVRWQWKPFLINCFFALAYAYVAAFDDPLLSGAGGRVILALLGLLLGLGLMLGAWRFGLGPARSAGAVPASDSSPRPTL